MIVVYGDVSKRVKMVELSPHRVSSKIVIIM